MLNYAISLPVQGGVVVQVQAPVPEFFEVA